MRKIYAVGESLVDIIFREGQPQRALAGGSMLNSAVSLGRLGLPISLITEYADDDVGNIVDSFLKENNVGTDHVYKFKDGKTALALAFLNEKNDARYTFYKNFPARRFKIEFPAIKKNDFLLYGSIYSVTSEIRKGFMKVIKNAISNGAFLIYDPNFRSAHKSGLESMLPFVEENLKAASLVRGSDEDFSNLFGTSGPDDTWKILKKYTNCLVLTTNSGNVYVRTESFSDSFTVKKITPVSTIGAGDNFNAGLIASFYRDDISRQKIGTMQREEWGKSINMAVEFATHVCMSYDNYISSEFAKRIAG